MTTGKELKESKRKNWLYGVILHQPIISVTAKDCSAKYGQQLTTNKREPSHLPVKQHAEAMPGHVVHTADSPNSVMRLSQLWMLTVEIDLLD